MMQGKGVGVDGAVTQCCDAREGGGGGWGSDAVL